MSEAHSMVITAATRICMDIPRTENLDELSACENAKAAIEEGRKMMKDPSARKYLHLILDFSSLCL